MTRYDRTDEASHAAAMAPVAIVDLAALARNVARLRALAGEARLLVAVKADAYGHGLVPVARALEREGVGWLGVATPDEATTLRRAGVRARIVMFGPVRGAVLTRLLAAGIDLTVTDEEDLAAVVAARAAATAPRRAEPLPPARLHLKIDTGMGRLGRAPAAAVATARAIAAAAGCELEAAWTHFACADEPDDPTTDRQLAAFGHALDALDAAGLRPPMRHAANSAALLTRPEARFELVRPGIAAYGHAPGPALARAAAAFEPVMSLSAPVVFVKRVAAGTAVSYGHRWRASRDTTVATVRIGYGDGYPRAFGDGGEAVVAGARGPVVVPVVGTVCMDQTLVDVGDVEVRVGDRALLFGPGGPDTAELAARIGTIPYELLTRLGGRVRKRYRLRRPPPDGTG